MKVCQRAFCSVYGFIPKRLLILRKKQGRGGDSLEPDRRGKYDKHATVDESLSSGNSGKMSTKGSKFQSGFRVCPNTPF